MKFVCLGFYDESKFAQLPPAEAQKMMEECMAYDDVLRRDDVFNSGQWRRIPVTGPEHLEAAKRELNRSKLFLNKIGLEEGLPEIGLDLDERKDALYYRSRTAQKRERKNGVSDSDVVDTADDGEDDYEDTGE